jgi:hypothetical protein
MLLMMNSTLPISGWSANLRDPFCRANAARRIWEGIALPQVGVITRVPS